MKEMIGSCREYWEGGKDLNDLRLEEGTGGGREKMEVSSISRKGENLMFR